MWSHSMYATIGSGCWPAYVCVWALNIFLPCILWILRLRNPMHHGSRNYWDAAIRILFNNCVRRFLADVKVFRTSFEYLMLSWINFGLYLSVQWLLDETDPSAHPGNAKVVIKPITSSNGSPRWAQWPRVAGRGGLRRVFILKNDLLKFWKCVCC